MGKTKKEKCAHCNKKQLICFECSHCTKTFCMIHRMPERHDCINDYTSKDSLFTAKITPNKVEKI